MAKMRRTIANPDKLVEAGSMFVGTGVGVRVVGVFVGGGEVGKGVGLFVGNCEG